MRLLIALTLLLACQVPAVNLHAGNQVELSCAALVPLCLAKNQVLLQEGDARALYWMGRYQFIASDFAFDQAYPWYRQAAAQGYAPALVMSAVYHWHGAGSVARDRNHALSLLRQAAASGFAPANRLLGYIEDNSLPENELAMLIRF